MAKKNYKALLADGTELTHGADLLRGGQMKLLYEGKSPLDPMHVRRQKRRAWIKEICCEAVGAIVVLAAFWAFIILMFLM
jgi:hypothetical protein